MASQFEPEPKTYHQKLKEVEKNSLNSMNQNGFTSYGKTQTPLDSVSLQSVLKAVDVQHGSMPTTEHHSPRTLGVPQWQGLRLTQKATAWAIALGTIPVLLT